MRCLEISSLYYLVFFPNFATLWTFKLSSVWLLRGWERVLSLFLIFSYVIYFFDIKILISQDKCQEMVWGMKTNLTFTRAGVLFNQTLSTNTVTLEAHRICPIFPGYGGSWKQHTYRFINLTLHKMIQKQLTPSSSTFSPFHWGNVGIGRSSDWFTSVNFWWMQYFPVAPERTFQHIPYCIEWDVQLH